MVRINQIIKCLACVGVITAVVACGAQRKGASSQDVSSSDSITAAGESVNSESVVYNRIHFGLNLFSKAVADKNLASGNVVVSPYSAGMALSMLADGANGVTKDELKSALSDAVYSGDFLKSTKNTTISSANSIWIKDGFSVKENYIANLENSYKAQINVRDFSDNGTVKEINKWCSNKTAGRIPQIIDEISPDQVMFLLNALYFKSSWASAFDKKNTFDAEFHGENGDDKVPFMHQTETFTYGEVDGNQYVVLPYKSDEYRMVICLPSENAEISTLIGALDADTFRNAVFSRRTARVALSLPKFRVNTALTLNGILRALGVQTAFTGAADFSGITGSSVAVDEVRQKCFVEVSEEGTEAAAVTSVGVRLTSVMPEDRPVVMNVNRPFVFAIVDSETADILFAGKIGTIEK